MSYIETDRLMLRTWMHADLDALVAIHDDPNVTRLLPDGARSREQWSEWIDRAIEEQEREGFSPWPVVRKSDGRLVGSCGLHRGEEGIEIACVIERPAWGSGFATEAARAVMGYARDVLKLTVVTALVDPRNRAAVALANRIGLRFDRTLRSSKRNMLRYRIALTS